LAEPNKRSPSTNQPTENGIRKRRIGQDSSRHLRRGRGWPWPCRNHRRPPPPPRSPAGSTPRGAPARQRPSTRTRPAAASWDSSLPCCPPRRGGQRPTAPPARPSGTADCLSPTPPSRRNPPTTSSETRLALPGAGSKISAMRGAAKGKAKAKGGARWGCTSRRSKLGRGSGGVWPGQWWWRWWAAPPAPRQREHWHWR
jgi:hypothetical protein